MSNVVTGTVYFVGQTEQVTETFSKRVLIIVDNSNPQYPQHIPLEATQDKTSLFDNVQPGHQVTVHYNMRGNLSNTPDPKTGNPRAFLSLQVWKMEFVQVQPQQGYAQPAQAPQPQGNWADQQHAQQQARLNQGFNAGANQAPQAAPPVQQPYPQQAPAPQPAQPAQNQPAAQPGTFPQQPPQNNKTGF